MPSIEVPSIEFSGFYYGEILDDLVQYLRDEGMDIDESPEEPMMQILRSFAVSGHTNNVLLDLCANEMYLPTAKLRDSVAALLGLIDYDLAQATPATATLVHKLAQSFSASVLLARATSLFATRASSAAEPVEYELLADYNSTRTDLLTACFAYDQSANVYTDHTADANGLGVPFTPAWGGGSTNRDCLYFGHAEVAWDKLRAVINASAAGLVGVWEFYDGDWNDDVPDSVTNIGAGLRFDLTGYLGGPDATGTVVRVRCNQTGVYEDCVVYVLFGVNVIDTTSFLGQTIISTDAGAYTVGRDWDAFEGLNDASSNFTALPGNRDIDYTLPKNANKWWRKTVVNGIEAYWIRFRVIGGGAPDPTFTRFYIDAGGQYLFTQATQGRTRDDTPLASSTGLPNQNYTLARFPVIDDATLRVYVTEGAVEEEWTRVDSLVSSGPADKHFTVDFDGDSRAIIWFGDGVNGKIPMAGVDSIRAAYRSMAVQNGNVAANTIVVNRGGVAFFTSTTNPRASAGWHAREGDTDQELERAKIEGPESLKTLGKATSGPDVVTLTERFVDPATASRLFSRCVAIEGAFGPKTTEAAVVKVGGLLATVDELDALELYFNGDTARKIRGVIVMNQRVIATNFVPKTINVVGTVYGGSLTATLAALRTLLNPEAKVLNVDGTESAEWEWDFGELVPVSKIINAVMQTNPRPRNFIVTTPAADVILATRELPVTGTLTITFVD